MLGVGGNPRKSNLDSVKLQQHKRKDISVSFIMLVSGCGSQTLWLRRDFMRSNSWTPSLLYYCPWRWSSRSFLTRPKALIFLVCSFDPLALFVWSPGRRSAFLWFSLSASSDARHRLAPRRDERRFYCDPDSGILFGQEETRAQESKFTVVTCISKNQGTLTEIPRKKKKPAVSAVGWKSTQMSLWARGAQSAASLCFVTSYVDSSASQRRVLYCLHSSDNLNYKLPFFLCVFWPYW